MERIVRCQGAIICEGEILLVKHVFHGSDHTYWWLPGGGQKSGETQEECVVREIKEETNLNVRVERLLLEKPGTGERHYRRYATYLCTPLSDNERPGFEDNGYRSIGELRWFSLSDESSWAPGLYEDHVYPLLSSIRAILGYAEG